MLAAACKNPPRNNLGRVEVGQRALCLAGCLIFEGREEYRAAVLAYYGVSSCPSALVLHECVAKASSLPAIKQLKASLLFLFSLRDEECFNFKPRKSAALAEDPRIKLNTAPLARVSQSCNATTDHPAWWLPV